MTGGGATSISPMKREKMRPWLESKLNSEAIPGLKWMDREKNIFSVGWKHGSRLGWLVQKDGLVFLQWAKHTGKYRSGEKSCNKRWKANFRSALHSLRDLQEVKLPNCITSGPCALRVYRFTEPSKKKRKTKSKKLTCPSTESCIDIRLYEAAETQTEIVKETAQPDSHVDEGLEPGLQSLIPTTVFEAGGDSSELEPMPFISQTTKCHSKDSDISLASCKDPLLSELQIIPDIAKDECFPTSGLWASEMKFLSLTDYTEEL